MGLTIGPGLYRIVHLIRIIALHTENFSVASPFIAGAAVAGMVYDTHNSHFDVGAAQFRVLLY
jgi:hypothetical protein